MGLKIHFFELDEVGVYRAGFKAGGERHIGVVWEQAGQFYVNTGAYVSHNLTRYNFTPKQSEAFRAFMQNTPKSKTVEFFDVGGI